MTHSRKKILLVGPSGVGKSACVKALSGPHHTVDMDRMINTQRTYDDEGLEQILERVRSHKANVIAISVMRRFLARLVEERQKPTWRDDIFAVVYLKTSRPDIHEGRLRKLPVTGKERPEQQVRTVLNSVRDIDALCSALADVIIDVDLLDEYATSAKVKAIVDAAFSDGQHKEPSDQMPDYLTKPEYVAKTQAIGGKHWASAGSRWAYHGLAVSWAKDLGILSAGSVLEMGPMGVPIVKNSQTMDYDAESNNPDWQVAGYRPTYIHDARDIPWPFKDKSFELLVSLRVFHHLVPKQQQCFQEARRIAGALILVVPSKAVHPRGIDREQLVAWNAGVEPAKEHAYPGNLGHCYLFQWGM